MKIKNIKKGVRVESKVDYVGVRIGDVGTVLEADDVPYIQWDRADANCAVYNGKPCTPLINFEFRRYKG